MDSTFSADDQIDLGSIVSYLALRWKLLAGVTALSGVVAYGATFLITPTFTARTTFISPQQQQSSASLALSSMGALGGLAGAAAGIKSPADQYISLMLSATVGNRLVERFKLAEVYGSTMKSQTLGLLQSNTKLSAGKKDNVITVDVIDTDPKRAADLANAYVEELRDLSNRLALTEAQQRRVFFETQLGETKHALSSAQGQLQRSGFDQGAIKSEPKAVADLYARTQAQLASAQVRLDMVRRVMADGAPEVMQLQATVSSLRQQLASYEQPASARVDQDYIGALREFKYQEALFEIYARQFELARADEAREGSLFQVLDRATAPERRSSPRRGTISAAAALIALLAVCVVLVVRRDRS